MSSPQARPHAIATRNEGPLHAALKAWYAEPGDRLEVPVDGRQIDLVRGELLVEIQTASFSPIGKKLAALLENHRVRLVHPIASERWIVRVGDDGTRVLGRRLSPRRGRVEDAFAALVALAELVAHPRFSFEVVFTREEVVRRHELGRAWRRKGWVNVERRLLGVVGRRLFAGPRDLLALLPASLPPVFTTAELALALDITRDLAQKMAYCLRESGAIAAAGKRGLARIYRVVA